MQTIISAGARTASSTTLEPRSPRPASRRGARRAPGGSVATATPAATATALDLARLAGDEVLDDEQQGQGDAEDDRRDDGELDRGRAPVAGGARVAQPL